jgi:hypothetical protein
MVDVVVTAPPEAMVTANVLLVPNWSGMAPVVQRPAASDAAALVNNAVVDPVPDIAASRVWVEFSIVQSMSADDPVPVFCPVRRFIVVVFLAVPLNSVFDPFVPAVTPPVPVSTPVTFKDVPVAAPITGAVRVRPPMVEVVDPEATEVDPITIGNPLPADGAEMTPPDIVIVDPAPILLPSKRLS